MVLYCKRQPARQGRCAVLYVVQKGVCSCWAPTAHRTNLFVYLSFSFYAAAAVTVDGSASASVSAGGSDRDDPSAAGAGGGGILGLLNSLGMFRQGQGTPCS